MVLAPDFPDALRRLSYALTNINDLDGANRTASRAFELDANGYNQLAVAKALVARGTPADYVEALRQARGAAEKEPDDLDTLFTLGYIGLINNDADALRQADTGLQRTTPNWPLSHFLHGFALTLDGHWEAGEQELLLSREMGVSANVVQSALATGISGQAFFNRWLRRSAYGFVLWLIGLLALFGGGLLSAG